MLQPINESIKMFSSNLSFEGAAIALSAASHQLQPAHATVLEPPNSIVFADKISHATNVFIIMLQKLTRATAQAAAARHHLISQQHARACCCPSPHDPARLVFLSTSLLNVV
jgi:hypothetical protein